MTPWLYVGAAAIAFGAGWQVNEWRWDSKESLRLSAELERAQESQRLTRVAVDKNRSVTDAYLQSAKVNQARAASAASDVASLRGELASITSDSASRFDFDGARIALLGRLLSEAVGLAQECGAGYAEAASRADALSAYVSKVLVVGQK